MHHLQRVADFPVGAAGKKTSEDAPVSFETAVDATDASLTGNTFVIGVGLCLDTAADS